MDFEHYFEGQKSFQYSNLLILHSLPRLFIQCIYRLLYNTHVILKGICAGVGSGPGLTLPTPF